MLLFETIRLQDGIPVNLDWHLSRMQRSAKLLDFRLRPEIATANTLIETIRFQKLHSINSSRQRCRLDYGPGEFSLAVTPYTPKKIESVRLVDAGLIDYHCKFTDRTQLETGFENLSATEEIIFVRDKRFLEGRYANVLIVFDDAWLTPATCLLAGTARDKLLSNKTLTLTDLPLIEIVQSPRFGGISFINAMLDPLEVLLPPPMIRLAVDQWLAKSP